MVKPNAPYSLDGWRLREGVRSSLCSSCLSLVLVSLKIQTLKIAEAKEEYLELYFLLRWVSEIVALHL